MEFTTHFGLHSQTTRLLGGSEGRRRGPVEAYHPPWVKPRSEGLGLPYAASEAVLNATFRVDRRPSDSALGYSRFTRRY